MTEDFILVLSVEGTVVDTELLLGIKWAYFCKLFLTFFINNIIKRIVDKD